MAGGAGRCLPPAAWSPRRGARAAGWSPGAGAGQEEGAAGRSAPLLQSWQGGWSRAGQGQKQMGYDQLL